MRLGRTGIIGTAGGDSTPRDVSFSQQLEVKRRDTIWRLVINFLFPDRDQLIYCYQLLTTFNFRQFDNGAAKYIDRPKSDELSIGAEVSGLR